MGSVLTTLTDPTPALVTQALEHVDLSNFFATATLDDLEAFHAFVDKVRDSLRLSIAEQCKPLEVLPKPAQDICDDVYATGSAKEQRIVATVPYVVKVLPLTHVSKRLKTNVRRILGGGVYFTTALGWAGQWDTFRTQCREKLIALGQPLEAFYDAQQLGKTLGSYKPPLLSKSRPNVFSSIARAFKTKTTTTTTAAAPRDRVLQYVPSQCHSDHFDRGTYVDNLNRECIYLHFLRMLALAMNDAFQFSIERALSTAGVTYTFTPSAVKSYERMYTKMMSREDHGQEPPPRAANNLDVVRCMAMFETADDMRQAFDAIPTAFAGKKYIRFKNGMQLSREDAREAFYLRLVLGTGRFEYDARKTMGELRSDPQVQALWRRYVNCSTVPPFVTPKQWRNQAEKAHQWLWNAPADTRVFVHGEVQMVLRQYKECRQRMHELYKVVRAVDVKALDQDFQRYTVEFEAAEQRRKDGDCELNLACRDGVAASLPRLLQGCTAVTAGRALVIAAKYGHVDCVLALLSKAPSIGMTIPTHAPEALWAVAKGHGRRLPRAGFNGDGLKCSWFEFEDKTRCDIAEILLDNGVDVENTSAHPGSALYWASWRGYSELVKLLISRNANVNFTNKYNAQTPLHVAADGELVRILFAAGANLHQVGRLGQSPLDKASCDGRIEPVHALLGCRANVHQTRQDGTSALFMAAQDGHAAVVHALLDAKAQVDQRKTSSYSPLGVACNDGHAEVVGMLIDAKADVNNIFKGRSALEYAKKFGNAAVVEEIEARTKK